MSKGSQIYVTKTVWSSKRSEEDREKKTIIQISSSDIDLLQGKVDDRLRPPSEKKEKAFTIESD